MKIIVVNGFPRAGKDEFMNICVDYINNLGMASEKISIIDSVKFIARNAGWDGKKDDKGRKLLNDIKRALEEYDDIPFKKLCTQINYMNDLYKGECVPFICCRNPKDINKLKKRYDVITIWVARDICVPVVNNIDDEAAYKEDYEYDYTIYNNSSLPDLEENSINLIDTILEEM